MDSVVRDVIDESVVSDINEESVVEVGVNGLVPVFDISSGCNSSHRLQRISWSSLPVFIN